MQIVRLFGEAEQKKGNKINLVAFSVNALECEQQQQLQKKNQDY